MDCSFAISDRGDELYRGMDGNVEICNTGYVAFLSGKQIHVSLIRRLLTPLFIRGYNLVVQSITQKRIIVFAEPTNNPERA